MHDSDCATNNGPAYKPGLCDCRLRWEAMKRPAATVDEHNELWVLKKIREAMQRDVGVE